MIEAKGVALTTTCTHGAMPDEWNCICQFQASVELDAVYLFNGQTQVENTHSFNIEMVAGFFLLPRTDHTPVMSRTGLMAGIVGNNTSFDNHYGALCRTLLWRSNWTRDDLRFAYKVRCKTNHIATGSRVTLPVYAAGSFLQLQRVG